MPKPTRARKPKGLILPAIVVGLLTLCTFSPVRENQFLNWDDDIAITDNPQIRSLTWDGIREGFAAPYGKIYNPMTTLSYAVEYKFFGYDSEVIHVNDLLLHTLNALLVLVFVLMLTENRLVAFVTALLFAIHPTRAETVGWATERKDVLYCFFYFAALISYLYYVARRKKLREALGFYLLTAAFMTLSAFSKAMAVSLPLSMLAVDFLRARKFDVWAFVEKIPFFVISIVFGLVAIAAQRDSGWGSGSHGHPLGGRLLDVAYAVSLYLGKAVVPIRLSTLYPYPASVSPLIPLLVIVLGAGVAYSLKYTRKIVFGFAFFFFGIAMILPWMASTKFLGADRLSYVALFGIFYLAAEGFQWAVKRVGKRRKWLDAGLALLTLSFCVLAYSECEQWHDSYTLMSHVIESQPRATDAYINRAMAARDGEQALRDYTKAKEADPSRVVVYNNRGLIHYNRGETDLALQDYSDGIARDPSYRNLYFNRMLLYFYKTKNVAGAWADLKKFEGLGGSVSPDLRSDVEKAYNSLNSQQKS